MEFSFDRSKGPQAQNASGPQAQQTPGPRTGPDLNTIDTSTIANDRLRKAIERNRSKQAERDSQRPTQQPRQQAQQQGSFFTQPSQDDQAHMAQQAELREAHRLANMEAMAAREAQKKAEYAQYAQQAQQAANAEREMEQEAPIVEEAQAEATQSPRARLRARMAGAASMASASDTQQAPPLSAKNTGLVSRKSVARPDDTEFVPVKRTPKKVAAHISYTTSSTRKKHKSMDPKYVNWLVKGSWIFCALMVLRLIFATGGVTDFYSQKNSVAARIKELTDIKKENMTLVREIERMRSDSGFQKKLVRDNLGFIAADEFLVLFPK